jgi:hypothetical protein
MQNFISYMLAGVFWGKGAPPAIGKALGFKQLVVIYKIMAERRMVAKLLKEMYEAPRASVRGVFLCDGIADTVSTDNIISQGGWVGGGTLRPEEDDTGDKYWMVF